MDTFFGITLKKNRQAKLFLLFQLFPQEVLRNCEFSIILHTVLSTIKKLDRSLSVHRLSPAWLVSPQALFACIATPGHETHRSLPAPLVRYAFEDLEVVGCTFRKEEHQSCRHQPNNKKHNLKKSILLKKKNAF